MDEQPPALVAEMWYLEPVELDQPEILAALRMIAPEAEAQAESLVVPHGSGADGKPPLLTAVMPASPLGANGKQRPDVSQTWDWAEAAEAVKVSSYALLVTEMFVDGSDAEERVAALGAVVTALASVTSPAAISWPLSQRVVDPSTLRPGDLGGVINVRLFEVAGDTGAMVMDTLGLYVFGLPDVQCHFRDRSPGEIAELLYSTGVYLFESGDVIADGNTISAATGDERFVCRRETALIGPPRPVLDVDLGDPYAAGDRGR